jgi:outer membrane protein assembly factor BamB
MKGDGSFKLVIGEEWHDSGAAVAGSLPRGGRVGFDPAGVRGVLDMVVDGQSLFQPADEDSVFFLVRDLLAALERLAVAEGTARVSFYESPHELVLQRIASRVYLTFYRGGHLPEVMVKDQQVQFGAFAEGVISSARDLLGSAREISPQAASDPLLVWMAAMIDRLSALRLDAISGDGVLVRKSVESTRFQKARNDAGFSFGLKFEATTTDLLCPGRPLSNDLNALLFRGRLAVHARGRRRTLGEGFLFLQAEKLLASVHQLLAAWEEGRQIAIRLISEGISVALKLTADDKLLVTLMDPVRPESIVAVHDLTPWQYADAVLGVARELRRLAVECAPQQRRNIRLETFSREVRTLASWAKEQQRGAVFNEDVDRYRRLEERRRVEDAREGICEASRLTFRERWRIEAEGLDLDGTMLCDRVALVSARGFVLGVETESGAIVWRRETDRAEARMQVAGRDGAVRVAPSGQVDMWDIGTGALRWRTNLAARSGGSPVVLVVDHGPVPGLVVVAEEERKLVALDLRTGEPRWRFAASRGSRFALRRHGRLLYVASSDSQLSAMDLEDGSLVWRFPGRTRFALPPTVAGDVVIAPGGRYGKQDGRMYAFDAYSGHPAWEKPLDGGALTAPIVAAGVALVPVRTGKGKHDLVALDTANGETLWRLPCDGWAESCALMALDDCFIVNAAGGVLRSIRAKTGEERWCTMLGPTCSDDVPVNLRLALRSGVLFVPADTVYVVRPEDGRVVHSLGGEPPVPDLMFVDPTCAVFVAEESGHVAMYELQRRFSVVNGKG